MTYTRDMAISSCERLGFDANQVASVQMYPDFVVVERFRRVNGRLVAAPSGLHVSRQFVVLAIEPSKKRRSLWRRRR